MTCLTALARNPGEFDALRDKLARNRETAPLFDTPAFTQNLEAAYLQMWDNHLYGGPSRHRSIVSAGPFSFLLLA